PRPYRGYLLGGIQHQLVKDPADNRPHHEPRHLAEDQLQQDPGLHLRPDNLLKRPQRVEPGLRRRQRQHLEVPRRRDRGLRHLVVLFPRRRVGRRRQLRLLRPDLLQDLRYVLQRGPQWLRRPGRQGLRADYPLQLRRLLRHLLQSRLQVQLQRGVVCRARGVQVRQLEPEYRQEALEGLRSPPSSRSSRINGHGTTRGPRRPGRDANHGSLPAAPAHSARTRTTSTP